MNVSDKQIDTIVDQIFAKHDSDKNGVLDKKEMGMFLDYAYQMVGRPKSNFREVNDLMAKYDKNRDGVIDKKELKEIFKSIFFSV